MARLAVLFGLCACIALALGVTLNKQTSEADRAVFKAKILEIHNNLRDRHHVPPLSPHEELCKQAQAEAEHKLNNYIEFASFNSSSNQQDPTADRNYNDNTWAYTSYAFRKLNATMVTAEWVAQEKEHNWEENYFNVKTGHFTQMVWGSTEEIGIGIAEGRSSRNKTGSQFVKVIVVRYSPPGNILDPDTFKENVLPLILPTTTPRPAA